MIEIAAFTKGREKIKSYGVKPIVIRQNYQAIYRVGIRYYSYPLQVRWHFMSNSKGCASKSKMRKLLKRQSMVMQKIKSKL